MDLNQLKKKLYSPAGEEVEDRPKFIDDLERHDQAPVVEPDLPAGWEKEDSGASFFVRHKKRIVLWGSIGLAVVLLGMTAWLLWTYKFSYSKSDFSLDIYGPERIVSGEEVTFIVHYKNNSHSALKNASLTFFYSPDSLPSMVEVGRQGDRPVSTINLGEIAAGKEDQAEFKTRVLGDKDSEQRFLAKIVYRPGNVNSEFANEVEFKSSIVSVPLVLSFDLPDKIVSGQKVNFSLKYVNTSDTVFENSKVKIEYPDGFTFATAQPLPSENNNIWPVDEIGVREEGRILISGELSGSENENKIFKALIGFEREGKFIAYAQTTASPMISASPLFIDQYITNKPDTSVSTDQEVYYRVKYKNTTDETIGPIVLTVKIDSQSVDWTSVKVSQDQGFFDSGSDTITWNASSLSSLKSLKPKEEGEVGFSLKVKSRLPISKFSDKNFVISTQATVDSPNVPLSLTGTQLKGQHTLALKINSNLVLSAKGYFADSTIVNSGPIPPRVGQKTTYTIYWQVLNASNDMSDVTVEGYLPSYVQWQNNFVPSGENIRYDAGSGKISWQIGNLSAGVGILMPVKQVVFQVALTPSISQLGQLVDILSQIKISGKDNFTGAEVSAGVETIRSDMKSDPTMGYDKGRVGQ